MTKKTFNECTLEYLEKTFGLEQSFDLSVLNTWTNTKTELSELEKKSLENFRDMLQFNVHHWNEQELSLHFIGPVFTLAKLTSKRYNLFAQRLIAATVNKIELYGKPDGILASGYRSPERPYFAFQEYKKERDPEGDPAGQTLAAMLVGQVLNENKHPIYGCYTVGRDWYFMALTDKDYAISQGFDATTEDVFDILRVLKTLHPIISELMD